MNYVIIYICINLLFNYIYNIVYVFIEVRLILCHSNFIEKSWL